MAHVATILIRSDRILHKKALEIFDTLILKKEERKQAVEQSIKYILESLNNQKQEFYQLKA